MCPDAAQLFERYEHHIRRYCLARLRDREEAADAVQSTFLRVYVALERGVVPRFESAWLYKIAHNVCLSRLEASGRRARIETPHDLDCLDEGALAAPQSEHEALAGLSEALEALPLNLRQAILLREWQGLSYAEIAAAMETTVPAVETLLYRARRRLAAALGQPAKARRAIAGLLCLPGLRGLLRRGSGQVAGTLSGASATPVVGAVVIALGGSGLGAAVAVADLSSRHPTLGRAAAAASTGRDLVAATRGVGNQPAKPASVTELIAPARARATVAERGASAKPAATVHTARSPLSAASALVRTTTAQLQIPIVPTLIESAPSLPSVPPLAPVVNQLPTAPTLPAVPSPPAAPTLPTTSSLPATSSVTVPSLPTTTSLVLPGG